jgi:heat shock protein HslJ
MGSTMMRRTTPGPRPARVALTALAALVLAAGCAGGSGPGAAAPGVPDEALGSWTLVAGSVDGQKLVVEADISMGVSREGEGWAANGVSACNSYFTSFVVEGDRLVASPVGSTMMACMPASVMELESLHLRALERVSTIVVEDDRLEATGEGSLLVFERAR